MLIKESAKIVGLLFALIFGLWGLFKLLMEYSTPSTKIEALGVHYTHVANWHYTNEISSEMVKEVMADGFLSREEYKFVHAYVQDKHKRYLNNVAKDNYDRIYY